MIIVKDEQRLVVQVEVTVPRQVGLTQGLQLSAEATGFALGRCVVHLLVEMEVAEAYRRNYAGSLDLETCVVEIGSAHAGVPGIPMESHLEDLAVDLDPGNLVQVVR